MPIPEPPPNAPPESPRIQHIAKHPAGEKRREVQVLIASNEIGEQHEVAINRRHYKFRLTKGWTVYDASHQPQMAGGGAPGKIEVQFISPDKDGTSMFFSYRGRPMGEEQSALFKHLMEKHTDVKHSEDLAPEQIQKLSPVFGTVLDFNQYAQGDKDAKTPFRVTACRVVSINDNTPALALTGEQRNHPEKGGKPDTYWYALYLDGAGDYINVHQIALVSATRETFDKDRPLFDQMIKSLSW
jgi:hypothetical protein